MKKQVEQYIPLAIDIIKEIKIADCNDKVSNKFNGYFSSFGASIVLSGMEPALAFYANKKDDERGKILRAIYQLITGSSADKPKKLLDYYLSNEQDPLLKQKILDAAVALKLAVRTYELVKD